MNRLSKMDSLLSFILPLSHLSSVTFSPIVFPPTLSPFTSLQFHLVVLPCLPRLFPPSLTWPLDELPFKTSASTTKHVNSTLLMTNSCRLKHVYEHGASVTYDIAVFIHALWALKWVTGKAVFIHAILKKHRDEGETKIIPSLPLPEFKINCMTTL